MATPLVAGAHRDRGHRGVSGRFNDRNRGIRIRHAGMFSIRRDQHSGRIAEPEGGRSHHGIRRRVDHRESCGHIMRYKSLRSNSIRAISKAALIAEDERNANDCYNNADANCLKTASEKTVLASGSGGASPWRGAFLTGKQAVPACRCLASILRPEGAKIA
jgi:hypothetical protein